MHFDILQKRKTLAPARHRSSSKKIFSLPHSVLMDLNKFGTKQMLFIHTALTGSFSNETTLCSL
jgi:hypothetical protein